MFPVTFFFIVMVWMRQCWVARKLKRRRDGEKGRKRERERTSDTEAKKRRERDVKLRATIKSLPFYRNKRINVQSS